jgi:hypothetical protein
MIRHPDMPRALRSASMSAVSAVAMISTIVAEIDHATSSIAQSIAVQSDYLAAEVRKFLISLRCGPTDRQQNEVSAYTDLEHRQRDVPRAA